MTATVEPQYPCSEPPAVYSVVRDGEILGYVAIDSTVRGRSCGGLRMLPDLDETELKALAHTMTLKYGLLGLPQGGAKAGLLGDPDALPAERRKRLAEFGSAIASMLRSRAYVPATDMGTDNADIRCVLAGAGMKAQQRELQGTRSGYYTALGVIAAAQQAASQLGLALAQSSVAIEGFGSVGSALARMFADIGARVVAVSTSSGAIFNPKGLDVKRLSKLAVEAGSRMVELYDNAERIDQAALFELPIDLLCPCARHHTVNSGNVDVLKARIICAGANNPITSEAERRLFERGVCCLPDFVTNCGGVLGGTMEFASIPTSRIEAFVTNFVARRIGWLLREAERLRVPTREIAEPLALQGFARVREVYERHTWSIRLFEVGIELYRRGWVPSSLVGRLALPYFTKAVA